MTHLKPIVAHVCCAFLIWMSAISGYVPAPPMGDHDRPALAAASHGSQHHGQARSGHAAGHRGMVEAPADPTAACIATCIELISDKILPKAAVASWKPDQSYASVQYPPIDAMLPGHRRYVLAYWPTGPPDDGWSSATGAARLVALNSRLRI